MLEGVKDECFKYITWKEYEKEIESNRGRLSVSRDYGWICPKCGEVRYGKPRKCKECDK